MKLKNLISINNAFHSHNSGIAHRTAIMLLAVFFAGMLFPSQSEAQKREVADLIVAVVNDNVILKSDVDSLVLTYQQQMQQPFSEEFWYSILNSEIEKYLMLEQAQIDSVSVTEDELSRKVNQQIDRMIQQAGSEEVLEDYFGKSIIELRRDWREMLRKDEIVNKFRAMEMQSLSITRPEVIDFFNKIPKDSLPEIPEQVKMAQIVRIPEPNPEARAEALSLAKALRDSIINHGADIEELAKKYSQGPSGPRGGLLPMIDIDDLVPEYSAAAAALEPGGISQVVETSFGFHVIRLNERVGDKISTNHVLIKINKEDVDEDSAKEYLAALKDSISTPREFRDMARKYSQDEATANNGGIIRNPQTGESFIALRDLDPSLYSIALLLEQGDISDPKPYTTNPPDEKKAFRIVMLLERVEEHTANLEQDYAIIEENALNRKRQKRYVEMIKRLRENFFVEVRIEIPERYESIFSTLDIES